MRDRSRAKRYLCSVPEYRSAAERNRCRRVLLPRLDQLIKPERPGIVIRTGQKAQGLDQPRGPFGGQRLGVESIPISRHGRRLDGREHWKRGGRNGNLEEIKVKKQPRRPGVANGHLMAAASGELAQQDPRKYIFPWYRKGDRDCCATI